MKSEILNLPQFRLIDFTGLTNSNLFIGFPAFNLTPKR